MVKPGLMHFNTSSAHLALLLDTILITTPVSHHNRKRLDPLQETTVSKYSLVNINPIRLRIVQLKATTCPHHFVTFMTTQSPNKQLGEPQEIMDKMTLACNRSNLETEESTGTNHDFDEQDNWRHIDTILGPFWSPLGPP